MGGANKQMGAGVGATPEIRQATLPTAADYRTEFAAQRQDAAKAQTQADLAKFIAGSLGDIGSKFGQQQPTNTLNQWRDVQKYSSDPNSGGLQFTPLSPPQVFDDQKNAVALGMISGLSSLASGALSGISYGKGSGSNMGYKG